MKEYFEKLGVTFDKIVIETSPFMRCVQTANEIALALGVKEVEINYLFAEHLAERDYGQYNPLPKLQTWENQKDLNDKSFKEFNLLSDKVRIVDKGFWRDNLMPRYIEKLSVVQERVMLTAEYFVDKFNELRNGGSFNKGQKVCYLVISHGMITM